MNKIAKYQESNDEGDDEDLEVSFYDIDVKIKDFKRKKNTSTINKCNKNNENFLPKDVFKDISQSRRPSVSQDRSKKNFSNTNSENYLPKERTLSREILRDRSVIPQFARRVDSKSSIDFQEANLDNSNYKKNIHKVAPRDFSKFKKRLSSAELDFVIDQYEILEFIGKGAFGKVYKAQNKYNNQKKIAIKEITISDSSQVKQLMSEINLLKKLKHPNIVKYHGFIQRNLNFNIFLEYCDGGSLKQYCLKLKKLKPHSDHVISENSIIFYTKQILNGLEYLHSENIIHRDIKAANLLLSNGNRVVKLADFGVSTIIDSGNYNNTVVGTPNWMAPEVITLETFQSLKSDIWSLASTIIELFTGHPPYYTLNSMAALHAIVIDKHPKLPDNFSDLAKDFLKKCFIKNYKLRWDSKQLLEHPWLNQNLNDFNNLFITSNENSGGLTNNEIMFSKSLNSREKPKAKLVKRAVTNPDLLKYAEEDSFNYWEKDFSKFPAVLKESNHHDSEMER